ncbi:hypothetical protein [Streptomyces gardneri]|uniref:Chaplin domain-containing protein n=1 Tax=Streptomyces gardneri TaxID=66892 RepID=A0A4Y3RRY9_9ACTN|nr:hypothetical protein [Streptomyces gardneri]GEB60486.1 hypothetical protein SGA01_60910 [Streptomyces gardneri]GHH10985.1 hypothetical protein GCM10017674_55800 [Streptomyces gardneri]
MRIIRGLLVAVSAGALTLGMVGTSHALGGEGDTLTDSCKGTFGACTQTLSFAPELLGDVSLLDTARILDTSGLIGTRGLINTGALLGTTGETAATGTTAATATPAATGTTAATGKTAATG